jgi:hypothetical protein
MSQYKRGSITFIRISVYALPLYMEHTQQGNMRISVYTIPVNKRISVYEIPVNKGISVCTVPVNKGISV